MEMHLTAVSDFVAFHIPEAGLLNKSSCSVAALSSKSDLDVQQARMGRENAWQNRTCKCICVFCDHCLNFLYFGTITDFFQILIFFAKSCWKCGWAWSKRCFYGIGMGFRKVLKNFLWSSSELLRKLWYKILMNFLQTSYELFYNILQYSNELFINFPQTYHNLLTNFLQTSYKLLTNFLQTSYKLLTNFLITSYRLLNKFLWNSSKLLMNVSQAP